MQDNFFRPSARLITTIGEDIIKDMHAAIVELVKNSYDADADKVEIVFEESENEIIVTVSDDGHGMSNQDIKTKWLVPSTSDKNDRRYSPKGRAMQGRKGIGRFASQILGEKLLLSTIQNKMETVVEIDWYDFHDGAFLDEIPIVLESHSSSSPNGTVFTILGTNEKLLQWTEEEVDFLIKELRKMLNPLQALSKNDPFDITVVFKDFHIPKYKNREVNIKPLPLTDYYNYRFWGFVKKDGSYELKYENKYTREKVEVCDITLSPNDLKNFTGDIEIDFRVFDRDPGAIDSLVNALYLEEKVQYKKNEAKRMIDDISGISIMRNRFRIRPYGDPGYDWLLLDKQRVNRPSEKLGFNQISGYIMIDDEEISNLVEKSARDGLKEDVYYDAFASIVAQLILYIEVKRYTFRKDAGLGRPNRPVSEQLYLLSDYSLVTSKVSKLLTNSGIAQQSIADVEEILENDFKERSRLAKEIERQFVLYQGQATLGKMLDVVLHEVRKPIAGLRNQGENIERAYNRYRKSNDFDEIDEILEIVSLSKPHLDELSNLFARLDPLATRRKESKEKVNLSKIVNDSFMIFQKDIEDGNIEITCDLDETITILAWKSQIYRAIVNIIENAVYWSPKSSTQPKITTSLFRDGEQIIITISNNGPPILEDLLVSEAIYDPGISAKEKGTGLGLSIAGEALKLNGGKLSASNLEGWVEFLIAFNLEGEIDD